MAYTRACHRATSYIINRIAVDFSDPPVNRFWREFFGKVVAGNFFGLGLGRVGPPQITRPIPAQWRSPMKKGKKRMLPLEHESEGEQEKGHVGDTGKGGEIFYVPPHPIRRCTQQHYHAFTKTWVQRNIDARFGEDYTGGETKVELVPHLSIQAAIILYKYMGVPLEAGVRGVRLCGAEVEGVLCHQEDCWCKDNRIFLESFGRYTFVNYNATMTKRSRPGQPHTILTIDKATKSAPVTEVYDKVLKKWRKPCLK